MFFGIPMFVSALDLWSLSALSPLFLIFHMRKQLFLWGKNTGPNHPKVWTPFSSEKVPKFGNAPFPPTLGWSLFPGAHLDRGLLEILSFYNHVFFFQSEPFFPPWLNQFGIYRSDFSFLSSHLTHVFAKRLSPTCLPGMTTFWLKFPTVWKMTELGTIHGTHFTTPEKQATLIFSWDMERWKPIQFLRHIFLRAFGK